MLSLPAGIIPRRCESDGRVSVQLLTSTQPDSVSAALPAELLVTATGKGLLAVSQQQRFVSVLYFHSNQHSVIFSRVCTDMNK